MQPQAVYVSDLYLYKATHVNIGLNTIKVPTYVTFDLDPLTSWLIIQTRFVTSSSCDLDPDITMPTSRKIFVSAGLYLDLSAGLDTDQVITGSFCRTFILDSSFHNFEQLKNDEIYKVNCGSVW